MQLSTAEDIEAGIANVSDDETRSQADRRDHRRAHLPQRRFLVASRAYGFLDAPPSLRHALHPALRVFRTNAEDPVGLAESEVDQRADGHLTGHLSSRRAAHAIRHEKTITDLVGSSWHLF